MNEVMEFALTRKGLLEIPVLDVEPARPTIYFLMNGDEVSYVGKTMNIRSRVAQHEKEKSGMFDLVRYFHVHEYDMCAYEVANIIAFNPPMNGNALDTRDLGYQCLSTALRKIKDRPKPSRVANAIRQLEGGWVEFRGSIYASCEAIEKALSKAREVKA